ncbi:MAG: ABC transporter substrate-binding protein [Rhodospirillaceae bacterium]|nr:ABC transporter substrate-binding protein [Rhodospirillaceae bacterium]
MAYTDPVSLAPMVRSGELPPIDQRLPAHPRVVTFDADYDEPGVSGGSITWFARRARDIRIMNVYGYARLVGYNRDFELEPDILESLDVEDERVFTLHLRAGHRWSDGAPFTADDFRFWWEDVATNSDLSPYGVPAQLIVDGALPEVTILNDTTVRYSWPSPNPGFLPALAGARPLYIYAPAHYLSQFHAAYADPEELEDLVEASGQRDWVALFIRRGDLYDADNVDLPTLQPWVNTTPPPSQRFIFERNAYFHRVDETGLQLPYLDNVYVGIVDSALIPARAGAGDSDLQARGLGFEDVPFLQAASERLGFNLYLWTTAYGSEIALYPNFNAEDPVWRELMRDRRFRQALSLAIDRDSLNRVVFYGLGTPGNNTALADSPVFDADRLTANATYDPDRANALLDEIGLTERGSDGIRLLPDGRPMELVVETSGERGQEIDALELIGSDWEAIGVDLYTASSQRDVFRTRVFTGEAVMSVWYGFDNALFTATTIPVELAPVDQNWLQYPKWGQYVQTGGTAGEPADMPFAEELMQLYEDWRNTTDPDERLAITAHMLDIHAAEVTSIGTVQGVLQPVVVNQHLHNLPEIGIYSWDPGAQFGLYRPDTFWLDPAE